MIRTQQFELHAFAGDEDGRVSSESTIAFEDCRDAVSARRKAGRLACKVNGPVDLAYGGDEPWIERYITTAAPSQYHSAGYRFERLEG